MEEELLAAEDCRRSGDFASGFQHLERAHVLGQASTREHVRVHWQMLQWAARQRQAAEFAAQVFRIVGAAVMTAIGLVPEGNTGGGTSAPFGDCRFRPSLQRSLHWRAPSIGTDFGPLRAARTVVTH